MENINSYLIIIVSLLAFYYILMLYIKQQSKFTPVDSGIPAVEQSETVIPIAEEPNTYLTEDTRMQFPLLPPVNPNARKRIIQNVIPANPDLYSSQPYSTPEHILDTPPTENTNQLVYSGGQTSMIKIPLQYNYPYSDQLRSQDILITPYNKVKYGNC